MSGTMPLWRVIELTEDPGTGRNIGLDAYPIYDEAERDGLNRLIVDHFLLRDIGVETISMFVFMMRRTMREIMPTYNQLYLSQRVQFDPLATYDLTTVRNGTAKEDQSQSQNSSNTSNGSSKSTNVYFDNPQVALSRNKDYAANATQVESESDNAGSSTTAATTGTTGETSDTSRTTGFQGSAADLLTRFRATIINTDMMLLNEPELTSMFLGVWDTPDEIMPPRRLRLGAL